MGEYRLLQKIARLIVIFFLVAFTISLIHLSISKDEALFKINSAIIYPALVCLILFICLILEWTKDFRENRKKAKTPVSDMIKYEYKAVAGVFLGVLAYVLVMKYVTLPFSIFPVATVIYAASVAVLINYSAESWLIKSAKSLLVMSILVVSIYYSFSVIFGVILP